MQESSGFVLLFSQCKYVDYCFVVCVCGFFYCFVCFLPFFFKLFKIITFQSPLLSIFYSCLLHIMIVICLKLRLHMERIWSAMALFLFREFSIYFFFFNIIHLDLAKMKECLQEFLGYFSLKSHSQSSELPNKSLTCRDQINLRYCSSVRAALLLNFSFIYLHCADSSRFLPVSLLSSVRWCFHQTADGFA